MENIISEPVEKRVILDSRNKDISLRGSDCIVYDYFGRLTTLSHCNIWYNSSLEYMAPKKFIKKTIKPSCIIS
jgi:hypothetical protein